MNSPASFKSLSKDGTLKKTDLFRVQLDNLHVEPGFNLREAGPELDEHVENLARAILSGDPLPPIEVRVADDGRVLVVDGHCRRAAYLKARTNGAPIEWIDVLPFRGNDADRVARIITSAAGKPLSPLETAMGYKRLASFNWSPQQIAEKFGKTRQHVDQWLILANANSDVHQLVREGRVAASVAVDAVRKYGEKAGDFLAGKVDEAKRQGRKKATGSHVKGKPLPRKAWEPLVEAVDATLAMIPPKVRQVAELAIAAPSQYDDKTVEIPVAVLANLVKHHGDVLDAREKQAAKQREAEAKAAQVEADL